MGKKILCIEDERFIGELYTRALKKAGFEVDIEKDGMNGLKLAQSGDYDVILLDIMLPSLNGVELLRKVKGVDVNEQIHSSIIITTNLDQREDVKKEVEELADGYLIKAEITPKELVDYVQKLQI